MRNYRCPDGKCPICKDKVTGVASDDGQKPIEGDLSVCANCGGYLIFQNDLTVRALDKEQLRRIEADDPMMWAEMQRIREQVFGRTQ